MRLFILLLLLWILSLIIVLRIGIIIAFMKALSAQSLKVNYLMIHVDRTVINKSVQLFEDPLFYYVCYFNFQISF